MIVPENIIVTVDGRECHCVRELSMKYCSNSKCVQLDIDYVLDYTATQFKKVFLKDISNNNGKLNFNCVSDIGLLEFKCDWCEKSFTVNCRELDKYPYFGVYHQQCCSSDCYDAVDEDLTSYD